MREGVTVGNTDEEKKHLEELMKYDGRYSLLELRDQISIFRMMEVTSEISSISNYLALTMSITKEIHGESYEVELYQGGTKTVKNWYKPSTLTWIIEDFEFLYKVIDDKDTKRAMSELFKHNCKQIVNQKKNIYGLKFCYNRMNPMLDYFISCGLFIDREESDILGEIKRFFENKKSASESPDFELALDEDEIPF